MPNAAEATILTQSDDLTPTRAVSHEYTLNWGPILAHLGASLLVSTYQAGKLVVISAQPGGLDLSYRNFEKAMGIAVAPGKVAVGAKELIWIMLDAPEIAARIEPAGSHDACFLTRSAHFTGEIAVHELAWSGDELWAVNTLFSCICTIEPNTSFVPRWKPPFITAYAAEDRCHLNGFAMMDGLPKLATAMAQSDVTEGWRATKATSGVLLDIPSGEAIVRGLCMPHSPRLHAGRIWMLDSGTGRLVLVDPARGSVETVARLPGYTRGLAIMDQFAFVGLSKVRETSTFGGVPIAEDRSKLKCGIAVVDLASGQQIGLLEFHSGVEEIFDVQLVPSVRSPVVSGPHPSLDDSPPIWMAAPPRPIR
jgi:uncharacterized protein (TIGR03032 family)